MERIVKNGNSSVLYDLAKRVGNVADRVVLDSPIEQSTNLVELTTVAIAGPKVAVAGPRVEIGEERKLEKRKKLNPPHSKKRLWIGVGCVVGLVALILGVVLLIRHIHRSSETNQTLEQLKACLSGMDVSKDVTELVVPSNRCNDVVILNMGAFTKLKVLSIGNDCFGRVSSVKLSGLSALERVVIGEKSFANSTGGLQVNGCEALRELSVGKDSFVQFSVFGVSGVPLLESLRVEEGSFRDGSELRLEGLSGLKRVVIGESVMVNREGDFVLRSCASVVELSVGSGSMRLFKRFEVAGVPSLETIRVGNDCFANVNEVNLEGLSGLKRMVVGMNSFTLKKNSYGNNPTRGFSLRNCPVLTTLEVGRLSFSDYSTCVIEGVNALEAIELGDLNEKSYNFYAASLELKSGRGCEG